MSEVLFIDLWEVPELWINILQDIGVTYEIWESQPIADQIKLSGCHGVPKELPSWIRRQEIE